MYLVLQYGAITIFQVGELNDNLNYLFFADSCALPYGCFILQESPEGCSCYSVWMEAEAGKKRAQEAQNGLMLTLFSFFLARLMVSQLNVECFLGEKLFSGCQRDRCSQRSKGQAGEACGRAYMAFAV